MASSTPNPNNGYLVLKTITNSVTISPGTITTSTLNANLLTVGTVFTASQKVKPSQEKVREELTKILNGCGGKRTPHIIDEILNLFVNGVTIWFCIECGSNAGCWHMSEHNSTCRSNGEWSPTAAHEACSGCNCSCHAPTDVEFETVKTGLLRVLGIENA